MKITIKLIGRSNDDHALEAMADLLRAASEHMQALSAEPPHRKKSIWMNDHPHVNAQLTTELLIVEREETCPSHQQ